MDPQPWIAVYPTQTVESSACNWIKKKQVWEVEDFGNTEPPILETILSNTPHNHLYCFAYHTTYNMVEQLMITNIALRIMYL